MILVGLYRSERGCIVLNKHVLCPRRVSFSQSVGFQVLHVVGSESRKFKHSIILVKGWKSWHRDCTIVEEFILRVRICWRVGTGWSLKFGVRGRKDVERQNGWIIEEH